MTKKSSLWRPGINPTVDLVIFRQKTPESPIEVLLITRNDDTDACPNMDAFPGGFVDSLTPKNVAFEPAETPEEAALRELIEETNLSRDDLRSMMKEVGYFDSPLRDPRSNDERKAVSTAFAIFIQGDWGGDAKAQSDAKALHWSALDTLSNTVFAFDHGHVLVKAAALFNITLPFEPTSWVDSVQESPKRKAGPF